MDRMHPVFYQKRKPLFPVKYQQTKIIVGYPQEFTFSIGLPKLFPVGPTRQLLSFHFPGPYFKIKPNRLIS